MIESGVEYWRSKCKRLEKEKMELSDMLVNAVNDRHGRWIKEECLYEMIPECRCSKCGGMVYELATKDFKYCPYCGAKMERKEE